MTILKSTRKITPTVWLLSLVSLFTDLASEWLYPVMPLYLKEIGFSIILIGVLEGLAEATAGLSKGYFGRMSDATGNRVSFIRWGYGLSALAKPLLVVSSLPGWVFFARTLDRLGKGLRTGARDAFLSSEAGPENKARVFGLHRSMDTLGAVIGPLLAILFLQFFPGRYLEMFLLAAFPGLLAVGTTFLLRNTGTRPSAPKNAFHFLEAFRYVRSGPKAYRMLSAGLLLFTLFNSSDVFLLLKVNQAEFSDQEVIGLYVLFNFSYALLSYPLGVLADRLGYRRILTTGFLLFALVYAGMAFAVQAWQFISLFLLYGFYAAATEGVSKAWISKLCPAHETATAIGSLAGLQSIVSLVSSSLAGLVWFGFGPKIPFLMSSVGALAALYFISRVNSPGKQ